MPGIGDELHHTGWNACSSCHHDPTKQRRYLIVPGVRSSNLHIVDCGIDPKAPRLHKVIEGAEIKSRTNLSAPHTVHCLGSDIIISMLGDARGKAPGGFLHLNENFEIVGRWENDLGGMKFNYDFWYQPRHNVMVSSEWAAPNTFMPGFDLEEVGQLKYGREIHFWDSRTSASRKPCTWARTGWCRSRSASITTRIRVTASSAPPSRPTSSIGASGMASGSWEKIIDVENVRHPEWPIPVPGLISVILISMDDRFLYFCNWLHGDIRQYDISDPSKPDSPARSGWAACWTRPPWSTVAASPAGRR